MKTIKKLYKLAATGALLTAFALNFSACTEQSPLESNISETNFFSKRGRTTETTLTAASSEQDDGTGSTVEKGSTTCRYQKRQKSYLGGKIVLSQGSQFEVLNHSLTPPADLMGQNVTLTMAVVQAAANNELLFEFGPHGSTFEPAATIWFHYEGSNPQLFYIENDGTYTEQKPDEVDVVNGWLKLNVHHFSRYAVAWSN